jgi:hypothetical protein
VVKGFENKGFRNRRSTYETSYRPTEGIVAQLSILEPLQSHYTPNTTAISWQKVITANTMTKTMKAVYDASFLKAVSFLLLFFKIKEGFIGLKILPFNASRL